MAGGETFETIGPVWLWRPADPTRSSGWHFLTIDGQTAVEIRFAALGRTGGFGSVKVQATIGGTRWSTSIFPQREGGAFILPIKAEVRKRENIGDGDEVRVKLTLAD